MVNRWPLAYDKSKVERLGRLHPSIWSDCTSMRSDVSYPSTLASSWAGADVNNYKIRTTTDGQTRKWEHDLRSTSNTTAYLYCVFSSHLPWHVRAARWHRGVRCDEDLQVVQGALHCSMHLVGSSRPRSALFTSSLQNNSCILSRHARYWQPTVATTSDKS